MILDEVGTYLQTGGIGTLGTSLFTGPMPATPAACVSILDYGGPAPDFTLGVGTIRVEHPRFQLLSRALTLAAARSKAQTAYELVATVKQQSLSGVRYLRIEPVGSVFFFRMDENARPIYACNFEAWREVTA